MKSLFRKTVFVFAMLLCASLAFTQDLDDVTISGKITDSNKLPITGATVTATLTTTGATRTVQSDDEGRYRMLELKPGIYLIKASMQGFGAKSRKDLTTVSGQNVQLNFELSPGDVTAETTVTAGGDEENATVDTTRTVVGGTVTEREIEEIPNNTRNPLDLVLTLGGTTEEPLSTRDVAQDAGRRGLNAPGQTPEEAGVFGLSGGAAYSNNITIDGLDNNDDRGATFRLQPSSESISEVQVITNQFSAEYGRASGGRVNLRTRGGSNKYKGRLFYFFRDESLNANTWNNNRRGISRPSFQDNNPGFTFGGPLDIPFGEGRSIYRGKDRTFFFTSYEYDNNQETTVLDSYLPFSQNTRIAIPSPNLSTIYCERAGAISPCTLAVPTATTVGRYVTPAETPLKNHIFLGRVDHNFNSNHNVTTSYQLGRRDDRRAFSGTNRVIDSLVGKVRDTDAFNASLNSVFSTTLVNQLRFQYSTLRPNATPNNTDLPVIIVGGVRPTLLNTPYTNTSIEANSQSIVFGSSTTSSSDRKENRFQIQESLTAIAGSHTLRFGADVQKIKSVYIDNFDATGTYRFLSFFDYLGNRTSRYTHNYLADSEISNVYYGVFFQDDWKVAPSVSLSYGVRYEKETVLDDSNNFGPRLAVAWNPFKGDKTVFRAGGGIFYNRVLLRTVDDFRGDSSRLNFDTNNLSTTVSAGQTLTPRQQALNYFGNLFTGRVSLDTSINIDGTPRLVRNLAISQSVFRSLADNLIIPESYQFNVGFERSLGKAFVFETNFTWNKTVHLWREFNPNAPKAPSNFKDLTDFLVRCSAEATIANCNRLAGAIRFERNGSGNPDTRIIGATTFVNLDSRNQSEAAAAPIGRALAAVINLRRNPSLGQQEQVVSAGNSTYKAATFELRSRYRKFAGFGGSVRFVYTLASLKDDGIVNTSEASSPGDFAGEFSRSLLDRRHRISITGAFELPKYLGKLRFNPLFRFGSSAPFNLGTGGVDRNLDDISNDRPSFAGDIGLIQWRKSSDQINQSLVSGFSLPPIGSKGDLVRNSGSGPQQYIFDLSVTRQFKIGEKIIFRPNFEFSNVLNKTTYTYGSEFIDFEATPSADSYFVPTRTLRPRQMRIGFRLDF
jgi:Carboxypeptidase regulatory-like domain